MTNALRKKSGKQQINILPSSLKSCKIAWDINYQASERLV